MSVQTTNLWEELYEVLRHHNISGASCQDTLNRLFRKIPHLSERNDLPILSEQTVRVSKESWNIGNLRKLITEKHITDNIPSKTEPPVVVIRWQNDDYLIDGRRRINQWMRIGKDGTHVVLLIEVT